MKRRNLKMRLAHCLISICQVICISRIQSVRRYSIKFGKHKITPSAPITEGVNKGGGERHLSPDDYMGISH